MELLDENYYKKLGKKLSRIREAKGLTQRKVAEAMGITFQQYQKYESGTNRIPTKSLVIFCNLTKSDVRELTGVSIKDYETKYKDMVVHHQHNYHTTYVNNFNGLFSNLFNIDLKLMKNKIAVASIIITLIIIFGINLLKFFPSINSVHNVALLSIQKLTICIAFSIVLFVVFNYSWLTYAISFYTYLGICGTLHRILYPELNMWSTNTVRISMYVIAFILTFITFYILKRCKVNLRKHENNESSVIINNYKKGDSTR